MRQFGNVFDYGKAITDGQTIASNAMALKNAPKEQALKQAEAEIGVLQKLGQSIGDEASWNNAVQKASAFGLNKELTMMAYGDSYNQDHINRFVGMEKKSPYGQVNPSQYTNESMRAFDASGRHSDLVARKKDPLVVNKFPGDDAYMKKTMEFQAEEMMEAKRSAQTAYESIGALERFIDSSDEAQQGSLRPLTTFAKETFASFGFDFDSLVAEGKMEQAINKILADYMQELGARGLTDKDMEILKRSLPRLEQSRAARVEVAEVMQRAYGKRIDSYLDLVEQESERFPQMKGKRFKLEWADVWKKRRRELDENEMQELEQLRQQQNAGPSMSVGNVKVPARPL